MQGVTIIASEEVMKNPDWMFYVPVVLILLALMVAIISNIIDNDIVGMITVVLASIFCILWNIWVCIRIIA